MKARELLTDYSISTAQDLFATWVELDKYLLVKHLDGNVKRESSPGCFLDNGSGKGIPARPIYGGYTDRWKRAVKKDAGEKLKVVE